MSTAKSCDICKFKDYVTTEYPCLYCTAQRNWEPADTESSFIVFDTEQDDTVMEYGDGERSTDGLKYDLDKVDLTYLKDWKDALAELCKLSEFGAQKYSRGGWTEIPDPTRLEKAMLRHWLFDEGKPDKDSGFLHDVAVAWNALSKLQIRLQNMK